MAKVGKIVVIFRSFGDKLAGKLKLDGQEMTKGTTPVQLESDRRRKKVDRRLPSQGVEKGFK